MLKLIIKNLWARRRRNGWLLAELVLVSIISWVVLDPVIVVTYDRNIPLGYDADRLCLVSLETLQPQAQGYDPEATDSIAMSDSYFHLIRRVIDFEGVEMAAPLLSFCYPNSQGSAYSVMIGEGDSTGVSIMTMDFLPHTRFFETYGFRPGDGLTPQELSDRDYEPRDLVLTENAAEKMLHSKVVGGKRCYSAWRKDTVFYRPVGTVGTFKAYSEYRPIPVAFRPLLSMPSDFSRGVRILVRLKDGVSMKRFMHDFRPWAMRELRMGNLFARSVFPYQKLMEDRELRTSTPIYRRNLAMALFFLVNLCLGVAGTFWLQTRTRREEVGIMLSFGATPKRILCLLMGEGALLTLVASLIGFFIYLQYAVKEGLHKGLCSMQSVDLSWASDFTQHFLIVSGIIFLILLAVVWVGIYLPARNISCISPTEALRDE